MTAAKKLETLSTAAEQPLAGLMRDISIADLRVAEWNARKTIEPAALAELAESIRTAGVLTPLIVRVFPKSACHMPGDDADVEAGKLYEIVAGHRRFEAARSLNLAALPCLVYVLEDAAAREVGLIDNLQRENVPAMEEAQAFAGLLTAHGSVAAVAARVKKEQSYVAKRLKLCSLTLCCQAALREGLIGIDHALLLARLGAEEEAEALKWCLDALAGSKKPVEKVMEGIIARRNERARLLAEDPERYGYYKNHAWEPQSVQRLRDHLAEEAGTPLARAPWPLDEDYLLPDGPVCIECPQNTAANLPLFGDLAVGEPTCTDGACFKEKTEAFVHIRLADAQREIEAKAADKSKAPAPLQVSWKQTSTAPRMDKESGSLNLRQVFKAGQWVEAKTKCEHVRTAVTVDWSDVNNRGYMGGDGKLRKPAEIIQVCVEPKCKTHVKDWAKPKRSSQAEKRATPEETKRLASQREFLEKTENGVRAEIWSAILGKLNIGSALRLTADGDSRAPKLRSELLKRFPSMSGDLLEAMVLFSLSFDRCVKANGYWLLQDCKLTTDGLIEAAKQRPNVAGDRSDLWDLAKSAGVDADAITVRHFAAVGIAPAADCLYPRSVSAEKAWKQLQAEREAERGKSEKPPAAKAKPSPKPTPKKPAKKAAKKTAPATGAVKPSRAAKKGGRK